MGLGERIDECGDAGSAERTFFPGARRFQSGQAFAFVHMAESRDGPSAAAATVGSGTLRAFWCSSFPTLASGLDLDAEPGELILRGSRLSVAVGLVVAKHVPSDDDELSRCSDDRHVAVLFLGELAEEHADRPRVSVEMMGGLDHDPAHVASSLLRDGAVIAAVSGLPS